MQVTETRSEGLKREYKVVLPGGRSRRTLENQLNEIKAKAHINGFRPGKVPVAHLNRLYGRSIMAEVMQEAVNDANRKIVEDNALRLAGAPKIDLAKDEDELEKAFEAKADLSYRRRPRGPAEVRGRQLRRRRDRATRGRRFRTRTSTITSRSSPSVTGPMPRRTESAVAETGDKATIDFVGKVGGEAFQGGSAEDVDLVLGSGSFIPGFEEQLVGMKPGEERTVNVTFPGTYGEPRSPASRPNSP